MGEVSTKSEARTPAENGAVQHLREALAEEGSVEKDFHVRQALQLLDVTATPADD